MIANINSKTSIICAISCILLSYLFVHFADLFLFSKVVFVPNWIDNLPYPLRYFDFPGFTRIAILICLLPVLLVNESLKKAGALLSSIILLSIIPVVLIYAGKAGFQIDWRNVPFQFFWVAIYHGFFPLCFIYLVLFLKQKNG
jgi:hypothetical protein